MPAIEIAPATAQDIINAMGPDAKGLKLSKEALPDLFALTANRIEENAKLFTVTQPYMSGRWKGGKVVIEYARDLSYTLVSVYDKSGERQRIYSVGTQFSAHMAHPSAPLPAPVVSAPTKEIEVASVPSPVVPTEKVPSSAPSAKPADTNISYEWDEAKAAYVPVAASSVVPDAAEATSEPPAVSIAAEKDTPPPKPEVQAEAQPKKYHAMKEAAVDEEGGGVWVPAKSKSYKSHAVKVQVGNTTWVEKNSDNPEETPVPKKRHEKRSKAKAAPESESTPEVASTPPKNTVPEMVVASVPKLPPPAQTVPEEPPTSKMPPVPTVPLGPAPNPELKPKSVSVSSQSGDYLPTPKPVMKTASAKKAPPVPQEKLVLHPQPTAGEDWVPRFEKEMKANPKPSEKRIAVRNEEVPAPTKRMPSQHVEHRAAAPTSEEAPEPSRPITDAGAAQVPVDDSVPSTEELLAGTPGKHPSKASTRPVAESAPRSPDRMAETPVERSGKSTSVPTPPAITAAPLPVKESVPTTEELLASNPEPSAQQKHKRSSVPETSMMAAPHVSAPIVPEAPPPVIAVKPKESIPAPSPETHNVPAPLPVVKGSGTGSLETHGAPAPPAAPVKEVVPSTEELLATEPKKSGPDTSGSDAWVPKATPRPKVAEPPPEPVKVAMLPKPVPVDNSVENLLNLAKQGKGQMPHEGDSWVPKNNKPSNPEVDVDQEVARIRAQEKKQQASQKPAIKIKRDINNPEEGVLPVSSFEKFSGPMYGRHREYERRFVPGKKVRSKAPEHDFYVDEIDRKKEIHNVYYYLHQKGKAPKLVAVERHDRVSFLGNYDIEKEDKGKISTY